MNNNRRKKPIRRPQPRPLRIPLPILKLSRESIFEAVSNTIQSLTHIKERLVQFEYDSNDKQIEREIDNINSLLKVLSNYQIPHISFAGSSYYHNSLQAYLKEKQQEQTAIKKLREYTPIKTVRSYH